MHLHLRMLMHMSDALDMVGVKQRLAQHGISVARLCRRADLAESTWHRWTVMGGVPRESSWNRVLEALEALVAEHASKAA